jgi:hypothetical protein
MLQKLIMHFKLKDFKQTAQIVAAEREAPQPKPAIPASSTTTYPDFKSESFGKY